MFKIPSSISFILNRNYPKLHHRIMQNFSSSKGLFPYTLGLSSFCYKQFDNVKSANYIPLSKESFLEKARNVVESGDFKFSDGYAPFCKHLFINNFTEAVCGSVEITSQNEHLLKYVDARIAVTLLFITHLTNRSGYLARVPNELPVLTRWFNKSDVQDLIKKAQYLDLILYSKEQMIKEADATNIRDEDDPNYKYDYYIVSVKPQDHDFEIPMLPITMMRNTLIEEGGSGVPINHDEYNKSVQYWSKHAIIINN